MSFGGMTGIKRKTPMMGVSTNKSVVYNKKGKENLRFYHILFGDINTQKVGG